MKISLFAKINFGFLALLMVSFTTTAQDEEMDAATEEIIFKGAEGFHVGFYVGTYFPNKNSVDVYDGYGYDGNGNKQSFSESLMYQKIVRENDPQYGFTDRIAAELGVISDNWRFEDDSFMPTNLKYNTAFLFGLALHYGLNKKQAIIANLNFSKLRVVGNFTIETYNSSTQTSLDWTRNQFALVGREQRLMIQLGYSQILGNNEKGNFFIEGGLCLNNAKVEENFIQINSLEIDLTYFDQNIQGLPNIYYEHYTGWGFGGFAGFGLNLTMNPKYTIQFLYNPSFESVKLGPEANAGINHAAGLRAYYNF